MYQGGAPTLPDLPGPEGDDLYSERGTQGCIATHRGSENVIDPFKTIKGIKRKMISEGLATLHPNLVTGTRLY